MPKMVPQHAIRQNSEALSRGTFLRVLPDCMLRHRLSAQRLTTPGAAREGDDPGRRRAAGVPGLDGGRLAVAAMRAAPARAGRQGQLRHFALSLVAAPAALYEQGGGLLRRAASIKGAPSSPANRDARNCMK